MSAAVECEPPEPVRGVVQVHPEQSPADQMDAFESAVKVWEHTIEVAVRNTLQPIVIRVKARKSELEGLLAFAVHAQAVLRALARSQRGRPTAQVQRMLRDPRAEAKRQEDAEQQAVEVRRRHGRQHAPRGRDDRREHVELRDARRRALQPPHRLRTHRGDRDGKLSGADIAKHKPMTFVLTDDRDHDAGAEGVVERVVAHHGDILRNAQPERPDGGRPTYRDVRGPEAYAGNAPAPGNSTNPTGRTMGGAGARTSRRAVR